VKKIIALMLASSVMLLTQTTLQAAEIKTAHNLVLRHGPGSHYAAGKKIAARTSIHIGVCNAAWCHISAGQQSGWVETARLLPNFSQKMVQIQQTGNRNTIDTMQGNASSDRRSMTRRPHASAPMIVRMRIISKAEAARRGIR